MMGVVVRAQARRAFFSPVRKRGAVRARRRWGSLLVIQLFAPAVARSPALLLALCHPSAPFLCCAESLGEVRAEEESATTPSPVSVDARKPEVSDIVMVTRSSA